MSICRICKKRILTSESNKLLSDGGQIHTKCVELLEFQTEEKKVKLPAYNWLGKLIFGDEVRYEIVSVPVNAVYLSKLYDIYCDYPPDWDHRRSQVVERDGGVCIECGSRDYLEVHHLKSLSAGGTNHIQNLISLCGSCHSKRHRFGGTGDPERHFKERLNRIKEAINGRKTLSFSYLKAGETKPERRHVNVREFVNHPYKNGNGTSLCVRGICKKANDQRTFAVKRMRDVRILKV